MKICVSRCLLGEKCLYHGGRATFALEIMDKLREYGCEIVPVCPEMLGGLPCPRPPAWIRDGRVWTSGWKDITHVFELGRDRAICSAGNVDFAILLEGSPSCDPQKGFFGRALRTLGVVCVAAKRGNGWEKELESWHILTPPPQIQQLSLFG